MMLYRTFSVALFKSSITLFFYITIPNERPPVSLKLQYSEWQAV